jgi:uncharacterized protein (DUF433 family)
VNAIGVGIYGIGEAARLLRRPVAQVKRWANGYTYPRTYDYGSQPPVLQTARTNPRAITFEELVELMYVRAFTGAGVPLTVVRQTAEALAKQYGPHPFASKPLLTAGRMLIAEEAEGLIAPATCQIVNELVRLYASQIKFEDDELRLWRPDEGEGAVVIDPLKLMGAPIIEATGTPTRVLYRTFLREQDLERVADYYDVSPELVKRAVEFEIRFTDAA